MDNEISKLNTELLQYKKNKKNLTNLLIDTMKSTQVECFHINGGSLLYKKKISKAPINKKSLATILNQYYKQDTNANVEELTQYILENRENKVIENITRTKHS
jgi:hypothetical protein